MAANLTDSERVFMDDNGIKTDYRILFWVKQYRAMRNRRQYDGPLPGDVAEDRRKNDELHEMEKLVRDIHAQTNKNSGVLKTLAQVFKFGGSEMDKHYPSKKK
jgi:hypothetical protein